MTYSITNRGSRALPFGFGLHPYFMKLSGEEGTIYDLRKPVPVGALDMDHVFTELRWGRHACIQYRGGGLEIDLEATRDFTHLVLYTPRGEKYFCLENQTCSTDAHNLYDRGFVGESGLKIVKPGAVHSGSVTYAVRY